MKKKQLIIIAICLGVILLGIGFAAFSSNLRISTTATVKPNSSDFSVVFSSSATTLSTAAVNASPSSLGDPASIVNGDTPTISGLKAKFTEPGQTVTYTFYARNEGKYDAYLNSIKFYSALGANSVKKCTASSGTNLTLVNQACEAIDIKIKVGSLEETSVSNIDVSGHLLAQGQSETVVVTITYAANATRADGPFDISFGDIRLSYGSVDNMPATLCTIAEDSTVTGIATGAKYNCNLGDTSATQNLPFYVVSTIGDNVKLLMGRDYDSEKVTRCNADNRSLTTYPTCAGIITKDKVAEIKESWSGISVSLPTTSDIAALDGQTSSDVLALNKSWLHGNYWIDNLGSGMGIGCHVNGSTLSCQASMTGTNAVRPAITIPKSELTQ